MPRPTPYLTSADVSALLQAPNNASFVSRLSDAIRALLQTLGPRAFVPGGRTLFGNGTIQTGDYGKIVNLAGYTLNPGFNLVGGVLGVQGPGSVGSSNFGVTRLRVRECAVIHCLAAGDVRIVAVNRQDASIFTASETPPANAIDNDEWLETGTGSSFVFYDGFWVERIGRAEFPNVTVRAVTALISSALTIDVNGYVRFTGVGAKTFNVSATTGTFVPQVGCIITLRNAAISGNVTIASFPLTGGPVLNSTIGGLVIPPGTTAQIMYQGDNVWDVL